MESSFPAKPWLLDLQFIERLYRDQTFLRPENGIGCRATQHTNVRMPDVLRMRARANHDRCLSLFFPFGRK